MENLNNPSYIIEAVYANSCKVLKLITNVEQVNTLVVDEPNIEVVSWSDEASFHIDTLIFTNSEDVYFNGKRDSDKTIGRVLYTQSEPKSNDVKTPTTRVTVAPTFIPPLKDFIITAQYFTLSKKRKGADEPFQMKHDYIFTGEPCYVCCPKEENNSNDEEDWIVPNELAKAIFDAVGDSGIENTPTDIEFADQFVNKIGAIKEELEKLDKVNKALVLNQVKPFKDIPLNRRLINKLIPEFISLETHLDLIIDIANGLNSAGSGLRARLPAKPENATPEVASLYNFLIPPTRDVHHVVLLRDERNLIGDIHRCNLNSHESCDIYGLSIRPYSLSRLSEYGAEVIYRGNNGLPKKRIIVSKFGDVKTEELTYDRMGILTSSTTDGDTYKYTWVEVTNDLIIEVFKNEKGLVVDIPTILYTPAS